MLLGRCSCVLLFYISNYFLDPQSGVPLYVQLQQQLQQRILSGQLSQGSQLPSVRDFSAELHLNPLTVGKVYQNLERDGFLRTQRGVGTYVAHQSPALKMEARRDQIDPAVERLVVEALHLGLGEKQIQKLLAEKFHQLNVRQKEARL